jgi:alpha,alpha-trehalose phosphorylase (configuration-retaining)
VFADDLEEYRKSVGEGTWEAVTAMAEELREKKVKIGFFSSTPQGGEYQHPVAVQTRG